MGERRVWITGMEVVSALGRGVEAQVARVGAFGQVTRFDTSRRRVRRAATVAGVGALEDELDQVISAACGRAGVSRAGVPLLLAMHQRPVRDLGQRRLYTSACVSASTAVADAAALIRTGRADRIVVAAGYLVEPDQFALFDAGRALADDGVVRPFGLGRRGTLLGDAVVSIVLEAAGTGLAELVGWARAGDAYHPCQPAPTGRGTRAAIEAALRKATMTPEQVGYVNANATGTALSDAAESTAIRHTVGAAAVSSTKGLHGHALEASGLLELAVTVQALREGTLPVNAGVDEPDPACPLDLVLEPRPVSSPYALSLNAAFGGANTALLVRVS